MSTRSPREQPAVEPFSDDADAAAGMTAVEGRLPEFRQTQVILAGIAALIVTVGISRFAYTPLLPLMLAETALSKAQGSWLATINYFGYLSGALLVTAITQPSHKWQFYRLCLLLSLLSTIVMGLTEQFWCLALARFVGGIASVAGLLLASAFVLGWLTRQQFRPQLGLHFVGMGAGISLAGLMVGGLSPVLSWAGIWLMLAVAGLGLTVLAWRWMPKPALQGLFQPRQFVDTIAAAVDRRWLQLMLAGYFCAGFAFAICATFLVVELERLPQFQQQGAWIWLAVGIVAAPAALYWDWLAQRCGLLRATALAYVLQIIGILLPLLSQRPLTHLLGALCFGATFIGIVSLMLTLAGRRFPERSAAAMGQLTLSYGAGQIIAPFIAGFVVQYTGNFQFMLWLAAGLLSLGLGFILRLQQLDRS